MCTTSILDAPGRPDIAGMVDPGRFLELSPDLFVALWQGLPIALNHAWTDTLGWELDELTRDQLGDLIHPDDLAQPIEAAGLRLPLTIGIGLSSWRTGRLTREDALAKTCERADRALYDAKHAGRNRVVFDSVRRAA